jgi:hypothetical protein
MTWVFLKLRSLFLNGCEAEECGVKHLSEHLTYATDYDKRGSRTSLLLLRALGLRTQPIAIVRDIVKPPCCLAQMVIALSRSKYEVENLILDETLERITISLEVG